MAFQASRYSKADMIRLIRILATSLPLAVLACSHSTSQSLIHCHAIASPHIVAHWKNISVTKPTWNADA
jgi:hypothetical protein